MSKTSFQALVLAAPQGDTSVSYIVTGSPLLLEDIDEALGSRLAEDSLGEPPANGLWLWEGGMITTRGFEGDYDVEYAGAYRRLTDEETAKVFKGEAIIAWTYPDEETAGEDVIRFDLKTVP